MDIEKLFFGCVLWLIVASYPFVHNSSKHVIPKWYQICHKDLSPNQGSTLKCNTHFSQPDQFLMVKIIPHPSCSCGKTTDYKSKIACQHFFTLTIGVPQYSPSNITTSNTQMQDLFVPREAWNRRGFYRIEKTSLEENKVNSFSSEQTQQMLHTCSSDTQHLSGPIHPEPHRSSISTTDRVRLFRMDSFVRSPELGPDPSCDRVKIIYCQAHNVELMGGEHPAAFWGVRQSEEGFYSEKMIERKRGKTHGAMQLQLRTR